MFLSVCTILWDSGQEAARVVKTGGTLIIAEVRSRFTSGPGDARPVGKGGLIISGEHYSCRDDVGCAGEFPVTGQSSKSSKARHGQSGVREPEQAGLSAFVSTVESFGFKLTSTVCRSVLLCREQPLPCTCCCVGCQDASSKMFVLFTLTRSARAGAAANRTPKATLKACTYKKR
jgi:hypothetical protein